MDDISKILFLWMAAYDSIPLPLCRIFIFQFFIYLWHRTQANCKVQQSASSSINTATRIIHFPQRKTNHNSLLLWNMAFYSHSSMFCFFAILLVFGDASAQLSPIYYAKTCPRALSTIQTAVNNAVVKEHRMGASLLRLHFHDCFVNACSFSPLSLYIYKNIHTDHTCTCTHTSTTYVVQHTFVWAYAVIIISSSICEIIYS